MTDPRKLRIVLTNKEVALLVRATKWRNLTHRREGARHHIIKFSASAATELLNVLADYRTPQIGQKRATASRVIRKILAAQAIHPLELLALES